MTVTVQELRTFLGGSAKAAGMVHDLKDMGKFAFIRLRMADGVIQCVYNYGEERVRPRHEQAVVITGELVEEPRSPHGFELRAEEITVLSEPASEAPDLIKSRVKTGLEADLKYRAASLRNDRRRAAFRIQAALAGAFRAYLAGNGFTEIFSPKIVAGSAEGGANIFKLEYFGQKAFLAQSPQFYKQTLVPAFLRVFEIAPVFRAEKHDTPRHLNEYISVDFEMGFIESFRDVCEMERGMLSYAFDYLRENCADSLSALKCELPEVGEIPYVTFREAKERVAERFGRRIKDPHDLEPEEERLISQMFKEDTGSDFVFVTHYPDKKRPFYAKNCAEDPKLTESFDLLYKGMEITTGGQRIHDYDEQTAKMERKGLVPADFESFLQMHKYGAPPHGGLGMGLERLCMKLFDDDNIRWDSMFPRDTGRLAP